jgi:hypothetical protein
VAFKVNLTAYSPTADAFIPWTRARVSVQRKTGADLDWKTVGTARTNLQGNATAVGPYVASAQWRVSVISVASNWDAASAARPAKQAIKFAWSGATRSGDLVTLKAAARRWSRTLGQYVPFGGDTVKFQVRSAGTWKTVRTVTTKASGVARTTLTASPHTWRAVSVETGTIWGAATGAHAK